MFSRSTSESDKKTFYQKKNIFPRNLFGHVACSYDERVKRIRGRAEKKMTQCSKKLEKTYFFPKNRLFLKQFLWTGSMKFGNPAQNFPTKDQLFLLHAQK